MSEPAGHHARVAAAFSDVVRGVTDWDAPTPVPEWTARDVVGHLVDWFPGFMHAAGVTVPAGPSAHDDPVAAWEHARAAVQALLDAPDAGAEITHPMVGTLPRDVAIDRFYTGDVFMHTWDLARASGQAAPLDDAEAAEMLVGMRAMEDVIRGSGQFGTEQPVAAEAPAADQLMAFVGRDPDWSTMRG